LFGILVASRFDLRRSVLIRHILKECLRPLEQPMAMR